MVDTKSNTHVSTCRQDIFETFTFLPMFHESGMKVHTYFTCHVYYDTIVRLKRCIFPPEAEVQDGSPQTNRNQVFVMILSIAGITIGQIY